MTNVGKTLYELQQIDLSLRKNAKRLQDIAIELANHAPVQKAQKQLARAEAQLKPLQTTMRDLELQVETNKQKREGSEQRLYSGTVSNSKELQDIEQNIAALKRWQSELEDKQLELMIAIEAAEDDLNAAQAHLDKLMTEAASSNQDLLAEKVALESEIVSLKSDRESVTSQLESMYLDLYEELHAKMAFRPIAILGTEGNCSICGVQQTSLHAQEIRRSNELLRCASCSRILIAI